jgi:hypothetical protein
VKNSNLETCPCILGTQGTLHSFYRLQLDRDARSVCAVSVLIFMARGLFEHRRVEHIWPCNIVFAVHNSQYSMNNYKVIAHIKICCYCLQILVSPCLQLYLMLLTWQRTNVLFFTPPSQTRTSVNCANSATANMTFLFIILYQCK